MLKTSVRALVLILIMTVLTGVVYPLAVTGITALFFPAQVHGSLLYKNGKMVGSALIGQNFSDPKYFQGRPSSAGQDGYDGTSSSGSNLGPTNKILLEAVAARADKIRAANDLNSTAPVPSDLVTSSASGLDPHISPTAANLQIARVAKIRDLSENEVKVLVNQNTEKSQFGFLGEPRVNVLKLNLALDALIKGEDRE
ncbi:MAG: K+-transporting ATPase, subunit [Firmicutes bacterium]|nr:K+-transporting ATPase, subunit [Bacillota bacterium]